MFTARRFGRGASRWRYSTQGICSSCFFAFVQGKRQKCAPNSGGSHVHHIHARGVVHARYFHAFIAGLNAENAMSVCRTRKLPWPSHRTR